MLALIARSTGPDLDSALPSDPIFHSLSSMHLPSGSGVEFATSWPIPVNEPQRQAALESYGILDTPPQEGLDRITRLASQILGVPIALISLVDGDRQWFVSRAGLDVSQTGRDVAFCAHAICGDNIFEVQDALQDPTFRNNPLVIGEPHIRFYAGVPLRNPEGFNLGTLCVIDKKPRMLSSSERNLLHELVGMVMHQLEDHRRTYSCQLTGLLNRRPFFEQGQREFHRAQRNGSVFSLLVFDIDAFRSMVSHLGARGHDQALLSLTATLQSKIRRTDLPARVADDECAVLLIDTDRPGALLVADSVRTAVAAGGLQLEGQALPFTVSCGAATLTAQDPSFLALFQRAGTALQNAKRHGRNRTVFAHATDQ